MEDAVLECGGADLGVVSRQQTGDVAQERSMTMRRIALKASLALDQTSMETSPAPRNETLQGRNCMLDNPSDTGDVERMQPRKPTNACWHPGVVISYTLVTVWIAHCGSVVKCARSQVRPFHDDDEAAHEHVTEHMGDLGERLLREGDFSYEDITGQDEPPVDSPFVSRKTQRHDPAVKERWMWT